MHIKFIQNSKKNFVLLQYSFDTRKALQANFTKRALLY